MGRDIKNLLIIIKLIKCKKSDFAKINFFRIKTLICGAKKPFIYLQKGFTVKRNSTNSAKLERYTT